MRFAMLATLLLIGASFAIAAPERGKLADPPKTTQSPPVEATPTTTPTPAPVQSTPLLMPAPAPDPTETATVVGRSIGDRLAVSLSEESQATREAIRQLTDVVKKLAEPPPRLVSCPCGSKCPGPDACDCGCGVVRRPSGGSPVRPSANPSPTVTPTARAVPVRQAMTTGTAAPAPAASRPRFIRVSDAVANGRAYGYDRTGHGWYGDSQAAVDDHIARINAQLPTVAPAPPVAAPAYAVPSAPMYYDTPPAMSYTMPSVGYSTGYAAQPSFGGNSCASGGGGCGGGFGGFFR